MELHEPSFVNLNIFKKKIFFLTFFVCEMAPRNFGYFFKRYRLQRTEMEMFLL